MQYDLTVNIELLNSEINVAFEYSTSFLSETSAQVIADAFQQALHAIVSDYAKQPCQLDIIGPISKQQIMEYNSSPLVSVDRCLHDLITERCDLQPSAQAVCAHDGNFTYAEIDRMSSALSCQLVVEGVSANVFVPVCFEKSKWTVIALLAIMKAGGAFVLLDVSFPLLRLQAICANLRAPLMIASKLSQKLAESLSLNVIVVSSGTIDWSATASLVDQTSMPSNALYAVFTSGSVSDKI
jgi:non-ribosomal peptide synthetase component F